MIKGHNPEKAKSGFTIFGGGGAGGKASALRFREQDFATLPVFPLRFPFLPNLITGFSALQMVHLPNIFSKNLFEMLINVTSPNAPKCEW